MGRQTERQTNMDNQIHNSYIHTCIPSFLHECTNVKHDMHTSTYIHTYIHYYRDVRCLHAAWAGLMIVKLWSKLRRHLKSERKAPGRLPSPAFARASGPQGLNLKLWLRRPAKTAEAWDLRRSAGSRHLVSILTADSFVVCQSNSFLPPVHGSRVGPA